MKKNTILLFVTVALLLSSRTGSAAVLFQEMFNDAHFSQRGWYDNTTLKLSSKEHIPGSTNSVEFHFLKGARTPEISGDAIRKKFTETDALFISYYVKHSSNWIGSGLPYHPHEFYLLTNMDGGACGNYCGLSVDHLTVYIEENGAKPVIAIQDVLNIDQSKIGQDLANVTEQRAVAGCNGYSQADGSDPEDCYRASDGYRNDKTWRTSSMYFQDVAGQYYKGDWHHVEAYVKLNSIVNGKGVADGLLQYWLDGILLMNHNNVLFRTGQFPTMKFNQFVIAPYIGDGSPVDQALWIGDLAVATSRSTGTMSSNTIPSQPKNRRVQ